MYKIVKQFYYSDISMIINEFFINISSEPPGGI